MRSIILIILIATIPSYGQEKIQSYIAITIQIQSYIAVTIQKKTTSSLHPKENDYWLIPLSEWTEDDQVSALC
jgi:hypothetical protein